MSYTNYGPIDKAPVPPGSIPLPKPHAEPTPAGGEPPAATAERFTAGVVKRVRSLRTRLGEIGVRLPAILVRLAKTLVRLSETRLQFPEVGVRLPSPRTLLPFLLVLGIVGAFMTADRVALHWYAPEDSSGPVSAVESDVADVQSELSSFPALAGTVSELEVEVSSLSEAGTATALNSLARATRIARVIAALSPAGEACFDWMMFGDGSGAACGVSR